MRILITGANGQLGREVAKQFGSKHELIMTDIHNLDITRHSQVRDVFSQSKPQAVIHCAAYTNVDGVESDFDGAFKVNVIGSQNLAAQCLEYGVRMVYVSTDYVFDGQSLQAYREYDQTNPLNAYGKTKLLGEEIVKQILGQHYIMRTAWLYGDGNNFVKTMLRLAAEKDKIQVVNDQIGSPTFTKDLVEAMSRLIETDAYGTYHVSCNGSCSWYDFACEIFRETGKETIVEPISTLAFPRPAKRPANSVLENYMLKMTVGDPMRPWKDALQDYLSLL